MKFLQKCMILPRGSTDRKNLTKTTATDFWIKTMNILVVMGPIGSGKSTAVDVIKRALEDGGKPVLRLHLDELARELISSNSDVLAELKDAFGPYVVTIEGELNRQALASVAFKNPESVALLNEITHPLVFERITSILIEFAENQPDGTVIMESPYPFGLDQHQATKLYIHAPFEARIAHNSRFSATDFMARDRVQPREDSFRGAADYEIENTFQQAIFEASLRAFVQEHYL